LLLASVVPLWVVSAAEESESCDDPDEDDSYNGDAASASTGEHDGGWEVRGCTDSPPTPWRGEGGAYIFNISQNDPQGCRQAQWQDPADIHLPPRTSFHAASGAVRSLFGCTVSLSSRRKRDAKMLALPFNAVADTPGLTIVQACKTGQKGQ